MGHRILRKVVLPAILCANLALIAVPAVGQSGGQPDSADRVAGELADDLVGKMRDHREIHGQKVALQPLRPGDFRILDEGGLERLELLLTRNLDAEIRESYELVNRSRFETISRQLEERDDSDWHRRFMEIVQEAEAQIIISCKAVDKSRGWLQVECSADSVSPIRNRATAKASFREEWLTGPSDPDWAIASIAEAIAKHMQGAGRLAEVEIVESEPGAKTDLSDYVAGLLEDKVYVNLRNWRGLRAIGGTSEIRGIA